MKFVLPKVTIIAKLKLFLLMILAANTSSLSIYFCGILASCTVTYYESMALFLGYRVLVFMANKQMPLTDENVYFMSTERILWNVATLAILASSLVIKALL